MERMTRASIGQLEDRCDEEAESLALLSGLNP